MDGPLVNRVESKMNVLVLPQISSQALMLGSLLVALLLIAFILYIARKRSKARGSLVLLVGPADAGKTTILSTMIYGQTLPTHTSLFVNSSIVTSQVSKKQLCIVDVPGYERLRNAFKDYIPDAKAVVFVVDASSITRNGRAVAEYLHQVLHAITSLPPTHSLPPLLIMAHKADLLSASSAVSTQQDRVSLAIARVRTVLERELDVRRTAQAGGVGVEGLGAEGEETELGGLDCNGGTANAPFRFADWDGGVVSFVGTWLPRPTQTGSHVDTNDKELTEKSASATGLEGLREWLDDLS